MSNRLSVAMCTFNGVDYLEEQLASIATQSRVPDELVICDEGSVDGSLDVLQDFKRSSGLNVRLEVNPVRLGSTKNFEKAISLCSGELIALSDQDDVWMPERLRTLSEALSRDDRVGCVFTDAVLVDDQLQPIGRTLWRSQEVRLTSRELSAFRRGRGVKVLMRRNVVTGATLAFKSRLRDAVLPIPAQWVHDGWIAFIVAAVEGVMTVEEPLVKYRQHSANQIGVRKVGVVDRVRNALREDASTYQDDVTRYREAHKRLRALRSGYRVDGKLLDQLAAKIAHAEARATAPELTTHARLARVTRELVSGGYARYSRGLRSAAKDLMLR